MPKFKTVPWSQFSGDEQRILGNLQRDGLTVNAQGDIKVGRVLVTQSEKGLVGSTVALGVRLGSKPVGADDREELLETAQRIVRKLGVDRK